jgi:hypothetical protein
MENNRLADVKYLSYGERVEYGKRIEGQIIEALRAKGYRIDDPTLDEDKYKKIDGYIHWDRMVQPFQMKYRSTGDDILMEVTFLDRGDRRIAFNGRDFVTRAELFASLTRDTKTVRLVSVSELRYYAERMTYEMMSRRKRSLKKFEGETRILVDKSSRRTKVVFFARPETLRSYRAIEVDFKF